jgi:hypothetical protein
MKLDRLIKMCLNETYSKVLIGKQLFDSFTIQNGLKQGDALSNNCTVICRPVLSSERALQTYKTVNV